MPVGQCTQTLQQLHTGHQGIAKCRAQAKIAVWWPGLTKQLAEFVRSSPASGHTQT